VKAFADKKRDANGPFQMPAYAAVKIVADAIAGAKTTDPTKVAAYMHRPSARAVRDAGVPARGEGRARARGDVARADEPDRSRQPAGTLSYGY